MKKLLLIVLFTVVAGVTAEAQIAPAFANHLQYMLDSLCKKNKIKGISAAILVPGNPIWKGVSGVSHDNIPLTTDMYLPIGSNTKTFTAAILLKLQEENKLSIDDTIGKWFQNIPNVNGKITIRQMLNHTSGLFNYTNSSAFAVALNSDYNTIWQPEDMLPFIETPSFAPGTGWEYSNTNFLLSGLIIKKVLNMPYESAVSMHITDLHKLSKTVVFPAQTPSATIPHGWSVAASGNIQEDIQVAYNWSHNAFMSMAGAAGAIMSTAEDNVMFWDKMMTGKIVNNTSLSQLTTCVKINASSSYGLGIFRYPSINGHVVYAHGGTCFGYLNENLRDSINGICITVLSNQDSVGNNLLFSRVVTPLHKYLLSLPPTSINEVNNTNNVALYPNPANNYVIVKTNTQNKNLTISIYDMMGRKAINQSLHNGVTQISTEQLQSGIYNALITDNESYQSIQKLQIVK